MKQPLGKAIKASLAISLPVAGTFLLNILSSFVAVYYISRFGEKALAASALIISIQITALVISMSTLFAVSVTVGRAFGSGAKDMATRLLQQGWMLGFCMSIVIAVIFTFAPEILVFFNQPRGLAALTALYFHAMLFGVLPAMLQTASGQFAIGISKQKLVAFSSLLGLLTMIFLGFGLGFGEFGLPKLGIAGVGYAVAAQYWVGFLFLLLQFIFNNSFKEFEIFKLRPVNRFAELKQLFIVGWPISAQVSAELIAIFVITIMTGWLGEFSLSARQVTSQFLVFTIVPIIGLAQAAGVLVSQNIGKKAYFEVNRVAKISLALAFGFIIWFLLAFIFIPDKLASLYINIHEPANFNLLRLIKILFLIACVSQIFDSIRNITSGALRGLYDTRFSMVTGIIGLWFITLPLGYVLAFHFHLGVIGLSIGFAVGVAVASILQWLRWHRLSQHEYLQKIYS